MAGRRVYGGSDMSVLLQNEGISPQSFETLFSSGSSHGGFHGSRSVLNFEEVCGNTINQQLYHPMNSEEGGGGYEEEIDDCLHPAGKKRRLTVEQVHLLERNFEVENKLEPERKTQLAKDLGLQPRQVAIWFQNRRARWKTKQLEKDYEALKSTYNALRVHYENLLKEKDKLKSEVVQLTDKLVLKEKEKNMITDHQAIQLKARIPNVESSIDDEVKNSEAQILQVPKQEDLSSTNSADVFDSDSPRCTDDGLDHSDLSHSDDQEDERYQDFLKLDDDDNAAGFGFPVEDQSLWFWPQ